MAVDDVTSFGANVYGAAVSNATPVMSFSASGFMVHGAATTTPGWASQDDDHDGGSSTITFDTGTTLTGSLIVESIDATESRVRGSVDVTWSGRNAGDLTETWASS